MLPWLVLNYIPEIVKKKMDSLRFMASSLSNLVNDLADLIHKIKFNEDMIK